MLNNYAVYLCSHGRAPEGVHNFELAAANPLYRSPWAAYTNAGVCQRQAHHESEAAQLFARALQSNPAYAEAVFQASDLDLTQQKYAVARLRVDFFLTNNPATPDLLLLGWRIAQAQADAAGRGALCAAAVQRVPELRAGALARGHSGQPGLTMEPAGGHGRSEACWAGSGTGRMAGRRARAGRLESHAGGGTAAPGCRGGQGAGSRAVRGARRGGVRTRTSASLCRAGGPAAAGSREVVFAVASGALERRICGTARGCRSPTPATRALRPRTAALGALVLVIIGVVLWARRVPHTPRRDDACRPRRPRATATADATVTPGAAAPSRLRGTLAPLDSALVPMWASIA